MCCCWARLVILNWSIYTFRISVRRVLLCRLGMTASELRLPFLRAFLPLRNFAAMNGSCRTRAYGRSPGVSLFFLTVFFPGRMAAVDAWGQLDRIAIYGLTIERDIEHFIDRDSAWSDVARSAITMASLLSLCTWWIAIGTCMVSVIDSNT